jgi:hypothetical protein
MNPTLITKTSHGFENGDVVTLSAFAGADAADLNGRTVMVKNVTTNTLTVAIDTTGKTLTAANGTLTPVTYTLVGELTDFSGIGGGAASTYPVTHLTSSRVEKRTGLADEGDGSFSGNFVPGNLGQLAMRASRVASTQAGKLKWYRVTLSDLTTIATFQGYCTTFDASGAVDGKIPFKATVPITGEVAWTDD